MLQKKLSESDSKISNPEKSNSFIKKMKDIVIDKGKKILTSKANDLLDYEVIEIFTTLGEDINKLYSHQELVFKEISRKKAKQLIKIQKNKRKDKKKNDDTN